MVFKEYTKEEINKIIANEENLKNEIIESKGFILYMANQYSIEIPSSKLINTISDYSIRYIKEDIGNDVLNKKYTSKQIAVVMKYLSVDVNKINVKNVEKYNIEDLIKDIEQGNELPGNIDNVLKINVEDFNTNKDKILSQIVATNDWFDSIKIPSFIEKFFKELTQTEFDAINRDILIKNRELLFLTSHLLINQKQKENFTSLLEEHYKLENVVKSGFKNNLDNYTEYPFDKKEKDLFISLLKNTSEKDYLKISKLNGFDNFFNKLDYIIEYNIEDCNLLTEKEFSENIERIRNSLQKEFFSLHFKRFDPLFELKVSAKRMEEVFSEDFVKRLILDFDGFNTPYIDRNYNEKKEKHFFFSKQLLSLCIKDNEVLNRVGFVNLFKLMNQLKDNNPFHQNLSYVENDFQNILKNFNILLDSEFILRNFERAGFSSSYGNFNLTDKHVEQIITSMKDKPERESVNYLFALTQLLGSEQAVQVEVRDLLQKEIKEVMTKADKKDVQEIEKLSRVEITRLYNMKIFKKAELNKNYKNNLLSYTKEDMLNMKEESFDYMFKNSILFRKNVLSFDLEENLILDNKKRFLFLLENIKDTSINTKENLKIVKEIIKKKREKVKDLFLSDILTHHMSNKIMEIDSYEMDVNNFKKTLSAIKDVEDKRNILNVNNLEYEIANKKDKPKLKKKKYELIDAVNTARTEVATCLKSVSFNFKKQQLYSMPFMDAYKVYSFGALSRESEFGALMEKRFNCLNFEETKEFFNNKVFLKDFIDIATSYGTDDIMFVINPMFNREQNFELIDLLVKNIRNKDLTGIDIQKNDNFKFKKIIKLFHTNKVEEISNAAVIKHSPESIFRTYDFFPKDNMGNTASLKARKFTNDELLEAIDKIKEKGDMFIGGGELNIQEGFLASNYELENAKTKDIENDYGFKNYKEMLKKMEKDPINYVGFIHSSIVANFIESNKHEFRDITISEFYDKHINHKVIIQAIKEANKIIRETNNNEIDLNKITEKYGAIISNLLAYTYYSNGNDIRSMFSDEKAKEIIHTIAEEAPYFLFGLNQIGKINIIDEVLERMDDDLAKKLIEGLMIGSKKHIMPKSLRFSYEDNNWQSKNGHKLTNGLIDYCAKNNKHQLLTILDFMIKEHTFNEEKPYEKQNRDFSTLYMYFLNNQEFISKIEKVIFFTKVASSIKNKEKKEVKFKI